MSYGTYSLNRYQETSITTASPEQLVVMMYEGAILSLKQAATQIEMKDLMGKRHSINRATAIIQHLQGTLDKQRGGNIAEDLDRIYTYVLGRILEGSIQLKPAPLHEAVKVLENLLDSWEEIARQKRPSVISKKAIG